MKDRYNEAETRRVAENILSYLAAHEDKATVVGLSGELGAGKTTLTKSIAEHLGVRETVHSPTFVIAKFYPTSHDQFKQLVHVDAYRIESIDELAPLGWEAILRRPNTLVIVEWPERIQDALPSDASLFAITHDGEERTIQHG